MDPHFNPRFCLFSSGLSDSGWNSFMKKLQRFGLRSTIISLFFLLILASSSFAQNEKLDSLLQLIKTSSEDTSKVILYARVSRAYYKLRNQSELALKYADSTLLLSDKLGYEDGVYMAHYRYGEIHEFKGNFSEAIVHMKKYLAYYIEKKDAYKSINALFGLGKLYKYLGEYEQSIEYLYQAVDLCEKNGDYKGRADALNTMGGIFRSMSRYAEAIDCYKQSDSVYLSRGDHKSYAMGLQNLANVYVKIENYDTAQALYLKALGIIQKMHLDYEESIILGSLGGFYVSLEENEKALDFYLRSLAIKRKLPNKRSLIFSLEGVAQALNKLGKYQEAKKYLKEALDLAREINSVELKYSTLKLLANISSNQNDFRSAYQLLEESNQWRDSVFNQQVSQQVNELQTRYETQKKEEEIKLLAKENQLQEALTKRESKLKWASNIGLILVLFLVGFVVFTFRQRIKNQKVIVGKNEQIKDAEFKQRMGELEMKALRAQINPHFLFNCMNSINRMILDGENDLASRYLAKFSKLVRLILENAETSQVSLQNELMLLESYIQLESLRFKGKINYSINVDDRIDPDKKYLPSMVLQPFVENAIWHGLMHRVEKEPGNLLVSISEIDGRLFCAIEDNGVGREKAKILEEKSIIKNKSMGMKITEERLRLLSNKNWSKLIEIIDLKDSMNQALGTRVEISIPSEAYD